VLTFKYVSKEYITHSDIVQPPSLAKMAKTASLSLSPGKLLKAKLLVARADAKAKTKKSNKNTKATKSAQSSATKASKQPGDGNEGDSKVEIVEDGSGGGTIKWVVALCDIVSLLILSCSWSKKDMHYLTDKLLGLIDKNAIWKVEFGFNKGDIKLVNSGGKKIIEHHKVLAEKLFLADPSRRWDGKLDIKKLANTVKNWVVKWVPIRWWVYEWVLTILASRKPTQNITVQCPKLVRDFWTMTWSWTSYQEVTLSIHGVSVHACSWSSPFLTSTHRCHSQGFSVVHADA
jgi:hypothetical protein